MDPDEKKHLRGWYLWVSTKGDGKSVAGVWTLLVEFVSSIVISARSNPIK